MDMVLITLEDYRQVIFNEFNEGGVGIVIRGKIGRTADEVGDVVTFELITFFFSDNACEETADKCGWLRVEYDNTHLLNLPDISHQVFNVTDSQKQLAIIETWQQNCPAWVNNNPEFIWKYDETDKEGGHGCGHQNPRCLQLIARIQECIAWAYRQSKDKDCRSMLELMFTYLDDHLEIQNIHLETGWVGAFRS